MGDSPEAPAVIQSDFESGAQLIESTQRSNPSVRFVIFPVALSISRSLNRSLSYPALNCERIASHFPSGEYIGVESLPLFSAVKFLGFACGSASDSTQTSLFVLVASTSSMLLVYAISFPSGEN